MAFFHKKEKLPDTVEWMVVGLGNPGSKYSGTRHNCGFSALDLLAKDLGAKVSTLKWNALIGTGAIGGRGVLLMKPQTFMNLSGGPITEAAQKYHIDPEHIIVIHDDIHIAPGKMRIKRGGSDGGHNGIKDILYKLGSDRFIRVKVGVGEPQDGLVDHVLSHMEKDSEFCIKAVPEAVKTIVESGVDAGMAKYNGGFFGFTL